MTALITDHAAASIARLIEERKALPNFNILLNAFGVQVQELEQAWHDLLTKRQLGTAVGQQQDDIGKIVGQPRNGVSDSDYDRYLGAKIAVNNSEGRIEDVLRVARAVIIDAARELDLSQEFPAAMVLDIIPSGTPFVISIADILITFLRKTVSGGVRMLLQFPHTGLADTFQLGAVTRLEGAHSIGATTLIVDSTVGYDDTGSLLMSYGLAAEEVVAYTSKDATHFYGVSSLTNNHADDAHVETAADSAKGLGAAGIMNGAHSIGATTVNYFDLNADTVSRFPASGSLLLSEQLAAEELVTYTSRTSTAFTGVSSLTNNHLANATITGSGGVLSGILE